MPNIPFGPPYMMVRGGTTSRIIVQNVSNGLLQIDNWQYFAGSVNVIAGFSRLVTVSPGPSNVSIEVDFRIYGHFQVEALPGYASAEISLNFSLVRLLPFSGSMRSTPLIVRQGWVTPFGGFGSYFGPEFYILRIPFTRPNPALTETFLATATVESWAGTGGWAGANASVYSTRLESFWVCF